MTPSALFSAFNLFAIAGWLALAAGVVMKRPWLRDTLAGTYIPLAISAAYLLMIVLFFGAADGGFDTLENVQRLFTNPWAALAGWVHYLAFDLFMGARIARGMDELQLPRWPLVLILPLTFMFGPIGFLAFEILKATTLRLRVAQ